jgi:plastocyanin
MKRTNALLVVLFAALSTPGTAQYGPTPAPGADQACPGAEMVPTGEGKDGIPSLTVPQVVSAPEANGFIAPGALVLGVVVNGEARAYPHNVLWWHEVINDVLGGKPITVSFSSLTGSGMVYDPAIAGSTLSFGTSGFVLDNNQVLYDRMTDSLWPQMRLHAACGKLGGTVAGLLPVVQSTWEAWRSLHPETTAVSFNTGFARDYNQYPYGTYDQLGDTQLRFAQSFVDPRRAMKEPVLGLVQDGLARAYPYSGLGDRVAVNDELKGRPVLVVFDRAAQMALPFDRRVGDRTLSFEPMEPTGFPFRLRDRETQTLWDLTGLAVSGPLAGSRLAPIATYSAMWFAWAALFRGTEIYAPNAQGAEVVITIKGVNGNMSYEPNPAVVKVGQRVAWRNADRVTHTATQDRGAFDTGFIPAGATSIAVTPGIPGSFPYHCEIHPSMVATLIVQ